MMSESGCRHTRSGAAASPERAGIRETGRWRRKALACGLGLLLAILNTSVPSAVALGQQIPADEPCAAGARLFQAKQHEEAEPLLKRCLQTNGESIESLIMLTVIATLADRNGEAIRWGERAVVLAPDSPDARYWLGRALLQNGDRKQAQQHWEYGLNLTTEHAGILEGLARLAMERGEDPKAYGLLSQLQRLGVDESWVHRLLSDLARRKGMWSAALDHWRDALERAGEDAPGLLTAGELSILAGDVQGAVAFCQRAVDLAPSGATYGGLGEALFAAEQHEKALAALLEAVVREPREPRYQFNLANCLEIMGRVDEAEQHFQSYIGMAPDDPIGKFNYGIHLDKMGRTQKALSMVREAIELNRSLLSAWVIQGQLLEKLGRVDEALAVVETLRVRDPENLQQLDAWRARLTEELSEAESAVNGGRVRLQHIIVRDEKAAERIEQELAAGVEFALLATRFSLGSTAAQGGDINWVAPEDMVEPLRSVIARLGPGEVSSAVRSGGLIHFFRRIH